jgi:DNA-binding LytR/AlgR family response regulator
MSKRIIIIEDEPRAVKRLERLLTSVRPEWKVVAYADSVTSAIDVLGQHADADAVFADIQLADGLSFEAFEHAKTKLPIVFLTAYDHYAIRSFNHLSIDYLLKPSNEEDLLSAVVKLEERMFKSPDFDLTGLLAKLQFQQRAFKDRFLIKVGDKLKFFPIDDVLGFYSEDKITCLFTKDHRSYPIDKSLEAMEPQLDPKIFFRINRKFIISTAAIGEITSWSNSRLRLEIQGLEEEMIVVARERTAAFKDWLDS